ncbi:hypothetical protein Bacsa_1436 [Phocaeicola salanitronis DSM 18170]|uniref:Uncharacterized protein n=1 Tax=Phocaeicola salanitronis (strain DSM 18170 / JCM 13657 / CCUG 60908 / BL78) TaxID=667015 RepID=F0R8S3_PHOSB|nr:hypothetical protein Bacsa_1436 [Phocaeicola salanitronis DSM 18170]
MLNGQLTYVRQNACFVTPKHTKNEYGKPRKIFRRNSKQVLNFSCHLFIFTADLSNAMLIILVKLVSIHLYKKIRKP